MTSQVMIVFRPWSCHPRAVSTAASYDQIPYRSRAHPQAHPDRLATIGRLLGLSPPPVETARVLEIGCASGGHLLPLAQDLPGASFVGLDASAVQIARAREAAAALGLDNVRFEHADVATVGDLGSFDYIVCHGVYSWVDAERRAAILATIARGLAGDGVAHVSFNTHPGWSMRGMVRAMMLQHAGGFADPHDRIAQSRALLDFLVRACDGAEGAYARFLREEADRLRTSPDEYLFHEHLEAENQPFWFHEFAAAAAAHDLQYVGDSEFRTMLPSGMPPDVAETLGRLAGDVVRIEQYMDYVRNRAFRNALLCRADRRLDRELGGGHASRFRWAGRLVPIGSVDVRAPGRVAFRGAPGVELSTDAAVVKAAFRVLTEIWPQSMAWGELLAAARLLAGGAADGDAARLGRDLLIAWSCDAVEASLLPRSFVLAPGERPATTPLVRWQAARGDGEVTNRRHQPIVVSPIDRLLLVALDGRHDRDALVTLVEDAVRDGRLALRQGDRDVGDPIVRRRLCGEAVDAALVAYARTALLVA